MASDIAKRFPCPEGGCTKSFTRKAALQHHLDGRQHAGQQPFQCPQCPTRFVRKGDQKKHEERKHRHLARFGCGASSCSAAFATRHELNRHLTRFPEHSQEGSASVFFQEMTVKTSNRNPNREDIDVQYEEQASRHLVGCGGWIVSPAVPEGERAQGGQTKDAYLVTEMSTMSLENNLFLLSKQKTNFPRADVTIQPSGFIPLDSTRELGMEGLQHRWSTLEEFLQAFNSEWDRKSDGTLRARSMSHVRPLQPLVAPDVSLWVTGGFVPGDLPLTAESNSSAAVDATGVLQQLMESVRKSWDQYNFSDLEVNLDLLYTKLVNRFRSHRRHGVGVLDHEQHVMMLLRETLIEGLTQRQRIESGILSRLFDEFVDFCTTRGKRRSFDELEKDLPHWQIWDELAQISDEQEQKALIQKQMRLLVQQERQRSGHPRSGANLTLEWLEESIQCAFMARTFCKSIISGRTDSVMETVRTVTHQAVGSIEMASDGQEVCEMDLDVRV
ncbi:hypothetical protein AYL99_11459 [Fonsecaea erecta]|uniref:C2H2-type domain-containing protein n=1 Tax=Fonsecaea erecta TaxID=1367422 RepID=A0A178Z3M9_9EURO|nr:hypothetical protein AYL99_11459 [Fonsecaea erecta]OAP54358.1 hypothetical protein AYL99_11459 [Fonsecaea erecta]